MTRLNWDLPGERLFETGIAQGVLYTDGVGVAWTGLTAVTESPSGGDSNPFYADGVKYLNRISSEEFGGTIEAYTYPDEFAFCDGSVVVAGLSITSQKRKIFGLSYKTRVGNDFNGVDHGYKIHLVYNAVVTPAELGRTTIHEEPDPLVFSWEFSTTPVLIPGYKPSSHLVVNSLTTDPAVLASLEDLLYGSDSNTPSLPTPIELLALFGAETGPVVVVVDNGDGTFTVTAPDSVLTFPDSDSFHLDATAVVDNGDGSYTVTST